MVWFIVPMAIGVVASSALQKMHPRLMWPTLRAQRRRRDKSDSWTAPETMNVRCLVRQRALACPVPRRSCERPKTGESMSLQMEGEYYKHGIAFKLGTRVAAIYTLVTRQPVELQGWPARHQFVVRADEVI